MNTTEIKTGKRYIARVDSYYDAIVTVVEPKKEKSYAQWRHLVTYTDATHRYQPEKNKHHDTPVELTIESASFKFMVDDNGNKILTADYKRKQQKAMEKIMAQQAYDQEIMNFILEMAASGVEVWQTKAYGTGKYHGPKRKVICFPEEDFRKVNSFLGSKATDLMAKFMEEKSTTEKVS